jgi:putative alpha-1,2-mannosidase
MGNEVSLKTPWMYVFAGAPSKTPAVVRRVLSELYSNYPGGLPGNDDGGVLSAWYVFAAVGPYPQISGVGGLVIGSPSFPQINIRIAGGPQINISAPAAARGRPYMYALRLNGQDYASPWIPWRALAAGADLKFVVGQWPNASWGNQAGGAPPSFDGQ